MSPSCSRIRQRILLFWNREVRQPTCKGLYFSYENQQHQKSKHLAERRRGVAEAMETPRRNPLDRRGRTHSASRGLDQTYPFFAHPDYHYLTGIDAPGGVLAFDPRQRFGAFGSLRSPGDRRRKMWEGRTQPGWHSTSTIGALAGARRGVRLSTWAHRCAGCDLMKAT